MLLKGRFSYIIRTCSYVWMMILRYKQFSDLMMQNGKNSWMGYWFVTCDLYMDLAWEFHFPNSTGMSQITCICMLLITTFLPAELSSYCLLFSFLMSVPISPQIQLYTYCNGWLNQHRSHGPFLPLFGLPTCHLWTLTTELALFLLFEHLIGTHFALMVMVCFFFIDWYHVCNGSFASGSKLVTKMPRAKLRWPRFQNKHALCSRFWN